MPNEDVDNTCSGFEDAVSTCLSSSTFVDDSWSLATLDDTKFRLDEIYNRVVKPLECSLHEASSALWRNSLC